MDLETPEILENSFGFNRFSYIIAILSCVKWKFLINRLEYIVTIYHIIIRIETENGVKCMLEVNNLFHATRIIEGYGVIETTGQECANLGFGKCWLLQIRFSVFRAL